MKRFILSILFLVQCNAASLGTTPKCCPIGEVLEYDRDISYKCTKSDKFHWDTKDLKGFQAYCEHPRFRVLIEEDVVETYGNGTIVVNGDSFIRDTFCLESLGDDLAIIFCERIAILNKCNAPNEIVTGVKRVVPQQPNVIQQIWGPFTQIKIHVQQKKLICEKNNELCHPLSQNIINDMQVTTTGEIILNNRELTGDYCVDYKVSEEYEGFFMCQCGANDALRVHLIDKDSTITI